MRSIFRWSRRYMYDCKCTSGSYKSRGLPATRSTYGFLHKFIIVWFENEWFTTRKYIRTEGERRRNRKVNCLKKARENLRQLCEIRRVTLEYTLRVFSRCKLYHGREGKGERAIRIDSLDRTNLRRIVIYKFMRW